MSEDKITILIVEDDPIIAADLTYLMKDLGYSPFPPVRNVEDTLLMLNNIKPDCVLIDVTLEGDKDGVELAEEINEKYQVPIIFLTAHHDRATIDRIKKVQPDAYLVKPIEEHNIQTSIELALYNFSHHKVRSKNTEAFEDDYVAGNHFFIKVKSQLKKLLLEDVLYIEAYDNYSFIHTANQKYIVGSNLKVLENKLSEYQFIRIHRSYLINMKAIDSIDVDFVYINQHRLPLGKTYRDEFMEKINLL
jgi:DNA-binding LytR/AlgR family response regulator